MGLLPADPKQRKRLALGLAPLLLAGAYWHFVHQGARAEIAELEARLETLRTKNAAARALAAKAGPELEKKLALYEQHMVRLEQLIPNSEEVPELLHAMTLRAQEAGVELALMRPQIDEAGPYYRRQTYEMSVIGAYHDIGRFLAAVGSLPRIVTPIDLKLTSRKETDRRGRMRLEAQFRIQTYVLPAPPPAERRLDAST